MCDENTISGINADAEHFTDEVLEVFVYGTQASSVKQEVAAIIKEEYKFENDPLEQCNSNLIIRDNILNTPIVYTTKLDHMKAFDKIESHTPNEITEMILEESRPRLKRPELISFEPHADIITYIELNSLVDQMNEKVKIETSLRNEKLLKLCKPLKIVLKDIKKYIETEQKMVLSDNEEVEDRFADTNSDDEPLSLSVNSGKNGILKVFSVTITIAIKDKRSQEVDLYIVNSCSGIKSYYRTSKDQCGLLQRLHLSEKLIFLEYCCWVDREKRVKVLVKRGCVRSSVATYIRTPHNCLPRPCSCCCCFGGLPRKRYDEGLNILFKKKTMNEECITPVNNNNIIEKAFNYVPKVDDVISMPTGTKPLNILKNAVIIIKYQQIIFAQSDILGENYEIGSEGEIINYVRPNINRSIVEEKQLYQKHDKPNEPRLYIPHLICCWHRREEVIAHLTDYSYVLPSTLRFIRTPHICKVTKCHCCCKPVPLINFNLQHVVTHHVAGIYKKPDKTSSYKETEQKEVLKDKTPKLIYFNGFGRDVIEDKELNKHNMDKIQSYERSKKRKIPNQTKRASKSIKNSKQNCIDLTEDYCLENPIISHSIQAFSGLKTDTCLQPSAKPTANNNKNPAHLTTTPTTLTQSFLDSIKDFTLTVNESGKLTAMINTRPAKMSNVDVKMISDILLLASSHIEAIGITPQEFCNRVNSSKSKNIQNSSLIPELNSINSNIIKNKVNDELNVNVVNKPTPQGIAASTPNVKALRFNNNVPRTKNLRSVCSIFQAMSSLAGQKNQYLVEAYQIYFRETVAGDITQPSSNELPLQSSEHWDTPKTTEVLSIPNDKPNTVIPSLTPILKRKTTEKANKAKKKLRVIPASDRNIVQSGIVKNNKSTHINNSTFRQIPVNKASPQITAVPRDITNSSNLVLTQRLIDMVVPSLIVDTHKIITTAPQLAADSSVNSLPSAIKSAVPQTEMTKMLIKSDNNSSDNEVLQVDSEDNGKILDSNDATSQMIASVSKSDLPAKPVPFKNPMLFQILSKESTTPPQITSDPRSENQQASFTPLILKRPKRAYKKNKRTIIKEIKEAQTAIHSVDLVDELDIEKSLKTNVITVAKYSHNERLKVVNNEQLMDSNSITEYSDNDRLEVVNSKQLMNDNDEVECILGV